MDNSPEWDYSKIDTSFSISSSQYLTVSDAISRMLENENINKDTISGKDGSEIKIQFQVDGLIKSYQVWTPEYETNERKLVEFLDVNKIIAETANLKTKLVIE
jgi:hypothetical protein